MSHDSNNTCHLRGNLIVERMASSETVFVVASPFPASCNDSPSFMKVPSATKSSEPAISWFDVIRSYHPYHGRFPEEHDLVHAISLSLILRLLPKIAV
jgi:hypothetical protein